MQFDPLLMMSRHLLNRALHLDSWHLIGSDRVAPDLTHHGVYQENVRGDCRGKGDLK